MQLCPPPDQRIRHNQQHSWAAKGGAALCSCPAWLTCHNPPAQLLAVPQGVIMTHLLRTPDLLNWIWHQVGTYHCKLFQRVCFHCAAISKWAITNLILWTKRLLFVSCSVKGNTRNCCLQQMRCIFCASLLRMTFPSDSQNNQELKGNRLFPERLAKNPRRKNCKDLRLLDPYRDKSGYNEWIPFSGAQWEKGYHFSTIHYWQF